jgi:hypothetical protein
MIGLAGTGDLVATALAPQSRNRRAGELLALERVRSLHAAPASASSSKETAFRRPLRTKIGGGISAASYQLPYPTSYIRVTVSLVVVPSTVGAALVPARLPFPQPNPSLTSSLPSTCTFVSAPPASRLNVPFTLVVLYEHVTLNPKKTAVTSNPGLVTVVLIDVMLGRVPVKPWYVTCHGSVSPLTLALPPLHEASATTALVMYPIREPAVFAIVLECSDPSSVTGHLTSTPALGLLNSIAVHVALMVWLEIDKFLADAVPTRAPSATVAPKRASQTFDCFNIY